MKQAPRAWYERLRDFLLSKGFKTGKVDTTLFTKKLGNDLFVLQIYVDDIIFGSTNQDFCEEIRKMMASEFEMSMIGELSYFLGLQIKQMKNNIFVSQDKYIKDMLKKFGMDDAKAISTPIGTSGRLDWWMQRQFIHLWGQMVIWTWTLVATWRIKIYIGL